MMLEWNRYPLSRSQLSKLRGKACRYGFWFRVLSRAERGLIDLTIRVVAKVRSLVLARSLISIVEKLEGAMESRVTHLVKVVGRPLAQKLSEIAQSWGNKAACSWVVDMDFIQYLAIMQGNLSLIHRG